MDLDPVNLLVGLVVSSVGLGLFLYGRKAGRIPHIAAGIPLMIVPMFLPPVFSTIAMVGMVGLLDCRHPLRGALINRFRHR